MVNYTYNTTALDAGNSTADFIKSLNEQAGGLPFIGLLLLLWLIIFTLARGYGRSVGESFVLTSFVNTIIAAFGFFLGLIGWQITIIPILLLFTGIIIMQFN